MDNSSVHKPLLSSRGSGHAFVRKTPGFVNLAKWILKIAMWVLFTSWVALMFVFPAEFGSKLFQKWVAATSGTVFGVSGLPIIELVVFSIYSCSHVTVLCS